MQRASLTLLLSSNTLGLLQDPQSSKILTNQIASNTNHSSTIPQSSNSNQSSVFSNSSFLQFNPCSSKIFTHWKSSLLQDSQPSSSKLISSFGLLQDPQSSNSNQSSVFFKLPMSSNFVPAPQSSSLLQDSQSSSSKQCQSFSNSSNLLQVPSSLTNHSPLQAPDLPKVHFSFWFTIPFNVV